MFTHICPKRSLTSSAFSSQGKKCHQLTAHGSMQRTSVQRNRNTTYKIQNTKQKIQHTNTIVIIFALECAVVTSVIVDRKEWSLITKGSRGKPHAAHCNGRWLMAPVWIPFGEGWASSSHWTLWILFGWIQLFELWLNSLNSIRRSNSLNSIQMNPLNSLN